jgi:hypothetical protein
MSEDSVYCRHCGEPIYVEDGVWFHGSGYRFCRTTLAEPA